MTISRSAFVVALVISTLGGVWLASHGPTRAQPPEGFKNVGVGRSPHVTDLMLQQISLPFERDTTLEDVAKYLRSELRINVIIDRAALDRHELTSKSTVQLVVENVRLKTGLKLLLDQVGLTTRVMPEDNLLLITDQSESDEPMTRLLDEVKELHKDIHGLQDDVRDLRDAIDFSVEVEAQPQMRNPTIIEERPAHDPDVKDDGAKKSDKSSRSRPGV